MTAPDRVVLQLWSPLRERLIEDHLFYVQEGKRRLLASFEEVVMQADADRYAEDWLARRARLFDADRDDPGAEYEQAYEEGINFYLSLAALRDNTRLSLVAGMFHEWEKRLRDWLVMEFGHHGLGQAARNAIWRKPLDDLFALFEGFGWPVHARPFFADLDICRHVTNAHKHGNGPSVERLKVLAPHMLGNIEGGPAFLSWLDNQSLNVADADIDRFSDAICGFWRDLPENIRESQIAAIPSWLEKAAA